MAKSPEGSNLWYIRYFVTVQGRSLFGRSNFQTALRELFELKGFGGKEGANEFNELFSGGSAAVARGSLLFLMARLPHLVLSHNCLGHRLRAQSAHAARKVTRRLVMSKRNRHRQPLWIIENVLTRDFCIPLKYKYKSALSPSVLHLLPTSRTAMTTYTALGKVTLPIIISDLIRSSKNRAVWLYSLTSYRIYFHQYLQHVISWVGFFPSWFVLLIGISLRATRFSGDSVPTVVATSIGCPLWCDGINGLVRTFVVYVWSSSHATLPNSVRRCHRLVFMGLRIIIWRISATMLAPTPLLAANFMIFGEVIKRLGISYSRLTPRWCKYLTCGRHI